MVGMEFTEEYAVFQSALHLADKCTKNGLANFEANDKNSKQSVHIVSQAVQEIKRGLKHQLSAQESLNWNKCLASALTVQILKARKANLGVFGTRFDSVTAGFPILNSTFYFEVVTDCEWLNLLFQFFGENQLEQECKAHMIMDFLDHCYCNNQEARLEMLNKLCTKLLVTFNNVLYMTPNKGSEELPEASGSRQMRLMEKIIKCLQILGHDFKNVPFPTIFQIVLCHLNAVLALMGQPVLVLSELILLKHKDYALPETYRSLNVMDLVDIGALDAPVMQVNVNIGFHKISSFSLCTLMEQLSKLLPKEYVKEQLEEMCNSYVCVTTREYKNEQDLYVVALVKIFCHACCHLHQWTTNPKQNVTESTTSKVDTVIDMLTPTKKRLTEGQHGEDDSTKLFERALFVINEQIGETQRNSNWEEWLVSCQDNEIRFNQRWIQCLKDNMQTFSRVEYVVQLLQQMPSFSTSQRDQLQQVTLQIYSLLPIGDQDAVLNQVVSSSVGCQVLPYCKSRDYQRVLTDTFNRVVVEDTGLDQISQLISGLALQSPPETLCKIVSEAIHNRAQTCLMVQVLCNLPSLCSLHDKETEILMVNKLLEDAAFCSDISRAEWQNLVKFTMGLLQKQTYGDLETKNHTSLLLPEVFIQQVIVPRLCLENTTQTLSAIDLLTAGLNTITGRFNEKQETAGALSREVGGCLMAFLCVCINDSLLLWEGVNPGYVVLRDSSTKALQAIVTIMKHEGLKFDKNTWLVQFTSELDWTIMFMIDDILDHNVSKRIPHNLSNCVEFPNKRFDNGYATLYNVLELAKLCPAASRVVQIDGGIQMSDTSYQHAELVLNLCQILPNCICEEWGNLSTFLCDKMLGDTLKAKVHVCSLLTEVVLTLASMESITKADDVDNSRWNHLSACYVTTLKTLCQKNTDMEHTTVFHYITCVCHCLVSLPPTCKDSLMVLALDVMSSYQEKIYSYKVDNETVADLDMVKKEMDQIQCLINNLDDEAMQDPLTKKMKEMVPLLDSI